MASPCARAKRPRSRHEDCRDAGASFWQPHVFELAGLMRPGGNALRLTVTGSLATRYCRPVPYGLSVREGESPVEQA